MQACNLQACGTCSRAHQLCDIAARPTASSCQQPHAAAGQCKSYNNVIVVLQQQGIAVFVLQPCSRNGLKLLEPVVAASLRRGAPLKHAAKWARHYSGATTASHLHGWPTSPTSSSSLTLTSTGHITHTYTRPENNARYVPCSFTMQQSSTALTGSAAVSAAKKHKSTHGRVFSSLVINTGGCPTLLRCLLQQLLGSCAGCIRSCRPCRRLCWRCWGLIKLQDEGVRGGGVLSQALLLLDDLAGCMWAGGSISSASAREVRHQHA